MFLGTFVDETVIRPSGTACLTVPNTSGTAFPPTFLRKATAGEETMAPSKRPTKKTARRPMYGLAVARPIPIGLSFPYDTQVKVAGTANNGTLLFETGTFTPRKTAAGLLPAAVSPSTVQVAVGPLAATAVVVLASKDPRTAYVARPMALWAIKTTPISKRMVMKGGVVTF